LLLTIKYSIMPDTISAALLQAEQLRDTSDSWRLDTELLLAAALECQRDYLYTWPEQLLSAPQSREFYQGLERRKQGEPIAYIIGRKAFWDIELTVTPDVLIPRPETELIVETALELFADPDSNICIADLGTGSGAIALALAHHSSHWQITATDLSAAALAVAKHNASQIEVDNIEIQLTSWCQGLTPAYYDLIVSNPPYVEANDAHLAQGDVRFEPRQALVAGDAGLKDIQQVVSGSIVLLKKNGWLLLEHGYNQAAAVAEILKRSGFDNISCRRDLAGIERMTMAQPG